MPPERPLHTTLIHHDEDVSLDIRPGGHALKPYCAFPWSWFEMGWVTVLTEAELKTALGIIKHVNKAGRSGPSVRTICKNVGLHESTVRTRISRLVAYKLIAVIERPGVPNEYQILHPRSRPAFTRESRKEADPQPLAVRQGVATRRGVVTGHGDPSADGEAPPCPTTMPSKEEHVLQQRSEHVQGTEQMHLAALENEQNNALRARIAKPTPEELAGRDAASRQFGSNMLKAMRQMRAKSEKQIAHGANNEQAYIAQEQGGETQTVHDLPSRNNGTCSREHASTSAGDSLATREPRANQ